MIKTLELAKAQTLKGSIIPATPIIPDLRVRFQSKFSKGRAMAFLETIEKLAKFFTIFHPRKS